MTVAQIRIPVQSIVNNTGNITFVFPTVPSGQIQQGSLNLDSSPNATLWQVTASGQQITQFLGNNGSQTVTVQGGETLTVTGSGLNPGTALTCWFTGTSETDTGQGLPVPMPSSNSIINSADQTLALEVLAVTIPAGGQQFTFPLQPTDRSAIIIIDCPVAFALAQSAAYYVLGNQSEIEWVNGTGAWAQVVPYIYTFPIYGSLDMTAIFHIAQPLPVNEINIWIITVPDEVILGTQATPSFSFVQQIAPPPENQDIPATIAVPFASAGITLGPAPAAGFYNHWGTLTWTSTYTAATTAFLVGVTSGIVYAAWPVPVGAASVPIPLNLNASEQLKVSSLGGTAGALNVSSYYRQVPKYNGATI